MSQVLFVSPEMEFKWADGVSEKVTPQDIIDDDGQIYRILSPLYFVWLTFQLTQMEVKSQMGHISSASFEHAVSQFNQAKAYAIKKFGEYSVARAAAGFNPSDYVPPEASLYVSSNFFRHYSALKSPRDIILGSTVFRMLDPEYYAWLRHQMKSYLEKYPNTPFYEKMRVRFMAVHNEAFKRFGREALEMTFSAMDTTRYRAPAVDCATWKVESQTYSEALASRDLRNLKANNSNSNNNNNKGAFSFPEGEGDYEYNYSVSRQALQKVDHIKISALSLGWKMESLYQNRGHVKWPLGLDYGLACFLKDDDKLTDVTTDYIEIRNKLGNITRYRNPLSVKIAPYEPPKEIKTQEIVKPKKKAKPSKSAKKAKKVDDGLFSGLGVQETEYEV